jgi:DNA-binding CsgD family transcriptional regulator
VGRREELEFVERATNRLGTAGVVVAGAPGVGKTRLVREALARAQTAGRSTAWSQATRSGAGIPFAALAHLLPAGIAGAGPRNLLRIAADAIAERSPEGTLVLGIDDAHLLDDHSATLVHLLAETNRCAIVATIRADEAVPDSITVLWKDELVERLELQPLSREETDELLEQALEDRVDAATVHRLWTVTRGNVLFLRELVLGGLETSRLQQVRGAWKWRGGFADVPRLSDVLGGRLRALGSGERALLEVVAAAEPIALEVLEGLDEARWLRSAESTGLLEISAGTPQMAGISHPLYAEALRSETAPTRRHAIFRTLAGALGSNPSPGDLLRVATWRLEIGDVSDARLFVAAARDALARFDYRLAHNLATAARDSGGGLESQVLIAQALQGLGRFEHAEATLAAAERMSASETERAEVATRRALNLYWHLGQKDDAQSVLTAARSGVVSADLADMLKAATGSYHVFGGDTQKCLHELSPLVSRRSTSPRNRLLAALAVTFALSVSGQTRRARSIVRSVLELAEQQGSAVESWFGTDRISLLINDYVSLAMEGRLHDGIASAQAAFEESIVHGDAIFVGPHAHFLGWMTLACGSARTSRAWLRTAVDALDEVDYQRHLSAALADLAHAEALLGDLRAAEEALERAESERVRWFVIDESFVGAGACWTAVARGEITRGAQLALATARRVREAGQLYFEAACLHDAARLGMAARVASRLAELSGSFDGVLVPAYANHAAALAGSDPAGLTGVSEEFEKMGAILFAAEAAAEAARLHRREGRKGSALASAARARTLVERCEGAHTPALAHLDFDLPLTRREEEIATLAAAGNSNREIAERLVVSVRTVDNHLHSAYSKLGVRSRRELAPILLPRSE